jgi:hypothetical protein
VGYTAKTIACAGTISTPLVSKKQMAKMDFASLQSTVDGSGEILYGSAQKGKSDPNEMEVVTVFSNSADRNVKEFFPVGTSIPDPPNYRQEVDLIKIRCDVNKFLITRTEMWDASNQLVRMQFLDPATNVKYSDFVPASPFASLQLIFCPKSEAGLGFKLVQDQGSTVIMEVIDGSPAARAGVVAKDIISQIEGEPVSGLSLQQVVEKLRGPQNTKVAITINRSGQKDPIEFTLTREIIKMKSAEGTQK